MKFSLSTPSIEWIKTEAEYKAVKYQFEALDISKEESPEKKEANMEGSTRNPQDEETKTPERYRGYVDVSLNLDEIKLKVKDRESLIQEAKEGEEVMESLIENSQFGSLAKSDVVEEEKEEGETDRKLSAALRSVGLPDLLRVPLKDPENDIFNIMIRPPVVRYLATAFFTIATIGSMIF